MIPRVTSVVWCGLSKSLVFKKKEPACHAFDPFRATKRESSLAQPDAKDELIRLYTFNDADLSRIWQHRDAANRLGFAVQLCICAIRIRRPTQAAERYLERLRATRRNAARTSVGVAVNLLFPIVHDAEPLAGCRA